MSHLCLKNSFMMECRAKDYIYMYVVLGQANFAGSFLQGYNKRKKSKVSLGLHNY